MSQEGRSECCVSPTGGLKFPSVYLPTAYSGWIFAQLESYYEHYGADTNNRFANSVSFYGRIYNWLLFNEGYHQEHHLRPQAHWTQRPQVLKDFKEQLDASGRHVSKLPPTLAFLELHSLARQRDAKTQEE